jgi:hypothetical protein
MSQETVVKAEVGDRPADSIELVWGPSIVEPVVGNGECGSQLGSIEEVIGVPIVSGIAPTSGSITRGVLPKQVSQDTLVWFIFVKSLPEVLAKCD